MNLHHLIKNIQSKPYKKRVAQRCVYFKKLKQGKEKICVKF